MKILVSNDDGIDSPGIQRLAEAFADYGEVYVVAPHRERSTAGHSLTLHKPLRIFERAPRVFAATGTPADCVYLGVHHLVPGKPDLILSGINAGANLGTDVHYSGTVAAAREGALMNIKSYAFSMVDLPGNWGNAREPFRFAVAAKLAREVVEATKSLVFPRHTLMNVNIPNLERAAIQGIEITRQGFRHYKTEVTQGKDPRGRDYFWVGGPYSGFEKSETSDCHAVENAQVSVTPLTIDCTHNDFYATVREKFSAGIPLK